MSGLFITFEGPDGAGKTTQIKLLAEKLKEQGHEVILTREPGGTRIGDQIRALILAPEHTEMADRTEVLLYAAQRAQHVHELIIPALEQGVIVLCDRFIDASMAYQAAGLNVDADFVRKASEFAAAGLTPIRTYMLDLTAEESRRRLTARAANATPNTAATSATRQGALGASGTGASQLDRIELKPLDYHRQVREAFLAIAAAEPNRVTLLEATLPIEQLASLIYTDCKRFLSAHSI